MNNIGQEQVTKIFATEKGIVALDSPVKLKMLELLELGVTSFGELVEKSGKTKSTIFVHLDDLEALNLIEKKVYPGCKRKKYFVLNSLFLAFSQMPLRKQYNEYLDDIAISGLYGDPFIMHLFRTVRYGMEAYGFDPKPIMKRLGNDVGTKIGPEFKSGDFEGILDELSSFWKYQKLGDMTVIEGSKPEVLITDCYHCSKMPNVGKTLCSMDEGILEGIFSSRFDTSCNVVETECYGTGHNHCKFVIK